MSFQPEKYSSKLVNMAANAFDHNGYTMLGVACDYGKDVGVVQRLIDMGAYLEKPDHNMKKLPLHRAINNQLSSSNPDSLHATAVVQCLLKNGANTRNTCFQNRTPLFYAQSKHFEAAVKLIKEHMRFSKDYIIFQKSLLSGNTHSLKQILDGSKALALYIKTLKGWSTIFTAIHQSYAHRSTLNTLEILKKHHVDFNSTFYIKTYSGIPVYCSVNPIAYLLLRGGDSRLIDALIKHGADPEHYSIAIIKKTIELNPNNKAFDYVVKSDNNPYDVNSRKLLALFESKTIKNCQDINNTFNKKRFDTNSKSPSRFFESIVNKPRQDVSISDEEMANSSFGKGSKFR